MSDIRSASVADLAPRFRRRKYFLVRVADDRTLDIARFLRGQVALRDETRCSLLCPVRGQSLPLSAGELVLTMKLPATRWMASSEIGLFSEQEHACLLDLAHRGIVLSEPAPDCWHDLAAGEDTLEQMHWDDLAAVFHAHSSWQGVVGGDTSTEHSEEDHRARLEALRRVRGDPPNHFVQRADATKRVELRIPPLDDGFFNTLRARRTTRAFRTDEALSFSALETVLYAVFGTYGIKVFAQGIAAIKRTSPSGGALHPVEAYLLVRNVDQLATGLYHYETGTHALAQLETLTVPEARELATMFVSGQTYFAEAHVLVIHVARFDRNFWKYARHRKAYKAVLMDSAHLSQTLYLTAAHLGLGAYYTAAINDSDIGRRLRLRPLREAAVGINGVGLADNERNELLFQTDPYRPVDHAS